MAGRLLLPGGGAFHRLRVESVAVEGGRSTLARRIRWYAYRLQSKCACSDLSKKLLGVIENSLQASGVVNLIYIAGLDEFTYTANSLLVISCAFDKTLKLVSAKFMRRLDNRSRAKPSEADERKIACG